MREQQEGTERTKSRRGFAAMDSEKQREIAREGGRAAHKQGVAHRWTSDEAREAGRKGGERSRNSRQDDSQHGQLTQEDTIF